MTARRPKEARKSVATTSSDVAGLSVRFDPFAATFEDAQSLQELTGDHGPTSALYQWFEAQRLTAGRVGIESGTGYDVLAAVADCALHGLVMPDWLARAYLKRYRQVQQLHVASWEADSAFGKPYPLNAQVGAMRRRRLQRHRVWIVVTDYVKRHPQSPMDPLWRVFDAGPAETTTVPYDIVKAAGQIGCSRSTAQKLYREACESLGLPDDHAIRARLTGASLPASSAKVAGRRKPA
jgi:hypothetical protein